jgi:hypothetical protein
MQNVRRLTAEGIAAYRDWLKRALRVPRLFPKTPTHLSEAGCGFEPPVPVGKKAMHRFAALYQFPLIRTDVPIRAVRWT